LRRSSIRFRIAWAADIDLFGDRGDRLATRAGGADDRTDTGFGESSDPMA